MDIFQQGMRPSRFSDTNSFVCRINNGQPLYGVVAMIRLYDLHNSSDVTPAASELRYY